MKNNKNENKINYPIIFLVVLILFGIFNIVELNKTNSAITNQIVKEMEFAKPAQISLTIIDINKEECPKCLDISKVVKLTKDSQKTNVTRFTTKNYKDLDIQAKIKELNITKFPALIIEGNINKSSFLMKNIEPITSKINDETYVFSPIEAPYVNNLGNIVGKINLIALYNKNCINCANVDLLVENVNSSNLYLNTVKKIDISSNEGKNLISKYNIDKVPTLLLSKELKKYTSISKNWNRGTGSVETDGTYVLRTINPIYFSILENRSVGNIDLTILNDKTCKNCFNSSEVFPVILSKLGILSYNKKLIDINSVEGKNIISLYNLTKFPTMIIEGDTKIYASLKQVWSQVGTIEGDKYIFRNVELLQAPYLDLNKGEIAQAVN